MTVVTLRHDIGNDKESNMDASIQVVTLDRLRSVFDKGAVLAAVKAAYIAHADGKVISPPPGQLLFDEPRGDCHIKFGRTQGQPFFAVKIATGFYDNPKLGLPVNSGLILVMSARTGRPVALLADDGWLTSWRTAAAGCLAARALLPDNLQAVGLVGSGHQAGLQLEWVQEFIDTKQVFVWNAEAFYDEGIAFADKLNREGHAAKCVRDIRELTEACRLIYTVTPSTRALFDATCIQPGTHIVAIGADSPGKQELDSELFGRARVIATDDHHQCLDHGDFGNAVRAGIVAPDRDVSLGDLLNGKVTGRQDAADITIVDLTGIPALDIAMAGLFCGRLGIEG